MFLVSVAVYAATTVGTNISTDGTVTMESASTTNDFWLGNVIADDDDYTDYQICLNEDDFTGFPDFDTDSNASDDELDGARREPETWVTGTRGVDESDVSDDESDASDDESDTSNDELNEKFCITFEYDSHWNCYCKTYRVCGCGCDPLHDGW